LTLSWNQYPIYPLLSSFEMCWIQISLQCGDWKFWRNPLWLGHMVQNSTAWSLWWLVDFCSLRHAEKSLNND
jgi:hypothetical protein